MTSAPVAEATSAYVSRFEALSRERAGLEPGWLLAARRAAMERFVTEGFPTTRQEAWRFTSVAPIARTDFRLPDGESRPLPAPDCVALEGSTTVVFVNGRFAPELSSSQMPDGVRVVSLRGALEGDSERLRSRLGQVVGDRASVFAALNTAFFADGAFVEIAPGAAVDRTVHIVFLSAGSLRPQESPPPLVCPRILIVAGPRSRASVVESYLGQPQERYLSAAVSEILLEEGAHLDHYKLQRESEAAFHMAALAVRQARGSAFANHAYSFGGSLARNDIDVALTGEGGECVLNGLFVAHGDQTTDTHTRIDHAEPHCGSRELYKGILAHRSRGVFHGTILVRPGAQKTDALQVNRNLLLSRDALVNSTPALQISADDVKCKHGSTTGRLDAEALFYLRSRGLGEEDARNLLVHAFAGEVVEKTPLAAVREWVWDLLRQRLSEASSVVSKASRSSLTGGQG